MSDLGFLQGTFGGGEAASYGSADHTFSQETRALFVMTGASNNKLKVVMLDDTELVFTFAGKQDAYLLPLAVAITRLNSGSNSLFFKAAYVLVVNIEILR